MRYTEIAPAQPFEGAPRINLASVYGASPDKPILMKIPVTGARPLTYGAEGLPEGLTLENGIIAGRAAAEGSYPVRLTAENALGRAEKTVTLEIRPGSLQLTPLMGFTSWNAFGYEVTQADMEAAAARMTQLGLQEYGYTFINTDSGWQGEYGGPFDAIQPNEKFPDIAGMVARLHAAGYKCGIYSTPMLHAFGTSWDYVPLPPGCTQGEPDPRFADTRGGIGVIRKEKNNALQWAAWGFDYLKYDWYPSDPWNAELMRQELVKTDRDFAFCVTVRARPEYHGYWSRYCTSWRCNGDSVCSWKNLLAIYQTYFDSFEYINRGHFFDLDMLDTGCCRLFDKLGFSQKPGYGLSEDEQLTAYSMRAFLCSPIQLSSTLETVSDFEMAMYGNEEVIAINQDAACRAAKPYLMQEDGAKRIHVFRRLLENGDIAFCAFNLGETEETVKLWLDEPAAVRDVWAKKDLGVTETVSLRMMPHTVRILRTAKV